MTTPDNLPQPIDMVLHCPACGMQHIDGPDPNADHWCVGCSPEDCVGCLDVPQERKRWTNPPHRSHLCHGCGHIWRPADVPTNGVAAVKTKGKNDSAIAVDRAKRAGWLPIETAPKDGTRFLAWIEWFDGAQECTGQFKDDEFWPDHRERPCKSPTHWQPLPPAPTQTQPAQEPAP